MRGNLRLKKFFWLSKWKASGKNIRSFLFSFLNAEAAIKLCRKFFFKNFFILFPFLYFKDKPVSFRNKSICACRHRTERENRTYQAVRFFYEIEIFPIPAGSFTKNNTAERWKFIFPNYSETLSLYRLFWSGLLSYSGWKSLPHGSFHWLSSGIVYFLQRFIKFCRSFIIFF